MKLYVCWGVWDSESWPGRTHPCGVAYRELRKAGHRPEVVRARGLYVLPDAIFNRSEARQEVKRLTGSNAVPVLVTDDGEVVNESQRIAEWARENPAAKPAPAGAR